MKILITGSNGFLAGHLIDILSASQHQLVHLVRTKSPGKKMAGPVYTDINKLLSEQTAFDAVFHLASYIPYENPAKPNLLLTTTNIELTAVLVAAYTNARFIYASSVSVYGSPLSLPITTASLYNHPLPYGLSKLAGEAAVINHPNYAIVRFSSLFGIGMNVNTYLPRIVQQALLKKEITVYGTGSRQQNYFHAKDAAGLLNYCLLNSTNRIYLGVADRSYTNLEVANIIALLTGATIIHTGEDNSSSFVYDSNRLEDIPGWQPNIKVEDGLKEYVEWIKRQY